MLVVDIRENLVVPLTKHDFRQYSAAAPFLKKVAALAAISMQFLDDMNYGKGFFPSFEWLTSLLLSLFKACPLDMEYTVKNKFRKLLSFSAVYRQSNPISTQFAIIFHTPEIWTLAMLADI